MNQRKKKQAYTEALRREAVRRADQPGNSNTSVAKELGISAQQIYNWRRQFNRLTDKQFSSVNGVQFNTNDTAEIKKLKQQLADLQEENDFLKKAAAYFAKNQE